MLLTSPNPTRPSTRGHFELQPESSCRSIVSWIEYHYHRSLKFELASLSVRGIDGVSVFAQAAARLVF